MREQREPRDGYEPVPLWLVAVFGALLFWGGWYLATYNGGWRSDVLDENPAALYAPSIPSKPLDPAALGKQLFNANCIACHQADGQGLPGQYPPLAGSEWVNDPNPARVKRIVLFGLEGAVQVKGNTYNGSMPNFGLRFSDDQVAAVLTFVRTNKDWGNTAPAVPTESVTATRTATKGRILPWTPSDLMAVTQDDYSSAAPTMASPAPTATPAPPPAPTAAPRAPG
jgi:mono/diheme cytochrome c family protein